MCLEQLYSVFDHQGVFGLVEILRFWCDCCFVSVCVSLSWRMASEATVGLGLCLGECRVSGDW